jgi:adenylate cyclase
MARMAACYGQMRDTTEAEVLKRAILLIKPDFTISEFFRQDVLLEKTEDRELLREGLIKAQLPL